METIIVQGFKGRHLKPKEHRRTLSCTTSGPQVSRLQTPPMNSLMACSQSQSPQPETLLNYRLLTQSLDQKPQKPLPQTLSLKPDPLTRAGLKSPEIKGITAVCAIGARPGKPPKHKGEGLMLRE